MAEFYEKNKSQSLLSARKCSCESQSEHDGLVKFHTNLANKSKRRLFVAEKRHEGQKIRLFGEETCPSAIFK